MTYENLILSDNPIAYWRFGESSGTTAADSSGNGLSGVYTNSPTLGAAGALTANSNTAVTLAGSPQYIGVSDNDLLDPGDTFTVECWVKTSTFTEAYHVLLCKNTNGVFLALNTDRTITLHKHGVAAIVTSTTTITSGAWNHIVCTKSGSTVRLYLNGADVTGTVSNQTIEANANEIRIGSNFGSQYLVGSIDEVAIYAAALSLDRVLAHYNAGSDKYGASDMRLAWVTHPENSVILSTIAATSSHELYRIENLITLPVSAAWRSTGVASAQDITIAFSAAKSIDTIALVNHNISPSATITVSAGTDTTYANFTAGIPYREFIAFKWLFTVQSYRYWRIRITDTANTDGFIEVGYLVLSASTRPAFTFRQEWPTTPEFVSRKFLTEFGDVHTDEMYRRQALSMNFGPLTASEMSTLRSMYTTVKRNVYPLLLLPERCGPDSYFGRIPSSFEERIEDQRYVDVQFIEDSYGKRIGA